ncbi:hypothetical protein C4D60_Mb06t08680 [Musa balbisiana]|uniref:Uncharacterized protein n=1 Tax=Musa balbisiana TaxID=52838 RepID=A0A4S8IP25_MUSBA|nr:hypothetical protein C4D60_Mb06t08680 [Musa balbisiana]
MAARPRLLHLISSFFLFTCKRGARSIFFPSLLLPSSPSRRRLLFSFPIAPSLAPGHPLPGPRFRSSPSAASFTVDVPSVSFDDSSSASSHHWPEWERFLGKLRGKGYFEVSTSAAPSGDVEDEGSSVSAGHGGSSVEVSHVKNACLKFARGRFNIFSDTAIDPSVPKPAVKPFIPKEPSQKATGKGDRAASVEMKRGDWLCPNRQRWFLPFVPRNETVVKLQEHRAQSDQPYPVSVNG